MTACLRNAQDLLTDAAVLAKNQRIARSASLVVLALEELGKIPDINDSFLKNEVVATVDWKDFWKRYRTHGPKQKRIFAYGDKLKELNPERDFLFRNPVPYMHFMSDRAFVYLDTFKQRNFYVDFVNNCFQVPSESKEVKETVDFLYAFALERADSFRAWHCTERRSQAFLKSRVKYIQRMKASTVITEAIVAEVADETIHSDIFSCCRSQTEIAADVIYDLVHMSSSLVPQYDIFRELCHKRIGSMSKQAVIKISALIWEELRHRLGIDSLPRSAYRAHQMTKLLSNYLERLWGRDVRNQVFNQPSA